MAVIRYFEQQVGNAYAVARCVVKELPQIGVFPEMCIRDRPTRAEEVALSNAVNLYLSQLKTGTAVTPSFNTFYEFVATDYRRLLRCV